MTFFDYKCNLTTVKKAIKAKYFLVLMYFNLSKKNCVALDQGNFLPVGWIVTTDPKILIIQFKSLSWRVNRQANTHTDIVNCTLNGPIGHPVSYS